jgi:MFS family permease
VLGVQGAAMGALALSAASGTLSVWQIALGCALAGLGWATDNPVRRMLIGEAVGSARMGSAMSLDVVANNASRIAGPALGGTLLAAFGAAAAFAVALVIYAVAIGVAAKLATGRVAGAQRAQSVLRQMRDGFAAALRAPRLRAVLLITVIFNLFGWPCVSMIPVIGQDSLRLGAEGVGILASMDGIGALIGAGLVAVIAKPERFAIIYVAGTALYLCGMAAFALAPGASPAGLALLLVGVGSAGFATMQATLVFLTAPVELRGRAYGVLSTAIGTGLLGFLQLGVFAEWLGAREAVATIGFAGFVALVLSMPLWHALLRKE